MAPKIEVAVEEELEDLNVEPLRIRLSSQTDGCGDDDGRGKYCSGLQSTERISRSRDGLAFAGLM